MLPPGFSYVLLFQERGPVLLRYLRRRTAPLPGTLRWGDFLGGQKVTKDPPKAGPSPALWNPPRGTGCTCVLLVSALGLEGSHRWHRDTIDSTYFSAGWCFYSPGPYPGKPLFPAIGGMAPSGGNAACPGRPGGGNRLAIGPVARIAWCGGSNRGHGVTGRPENHRRGSSRAGPKGQRYAKRKTCSIFLYRCLESACFS